MARFDGFPCPCCGTSVPPPLAGGLVRSALRDRQFGRPTCAANLVHSRSASRRARFALVVYSVSFLAVPAAVLLTALGNAGAEQIELAGIVAVASFMVAMLITARSGTSSPYEVATCA